MNRETLEIVKFSLETVKNVGLLSYRSSTLAFRDRTTTMRNPDYYSKHEELYAAYILGPTVKTKQSEGR